MVRKSYAWFFIATFTVLCGCATPSPAKEALVFAAMGDGPRADDEWAMLERQLEDEGKDGRSKFIVHVGDIWGGADYLPEEHYVRVAQCLKRSAIPVVIVPGDNEWNDLDDPDLGWKYWERHLLGLEQHWKNAPALWRQDVRPENVAWVSNRVLLIGINLVGGAVHDPDEWATRHLQDAQWVSENFERYGAGVSSAVVFAQASPNRKHAVFLDGFKSAANDFGKPVLYLHGDGHVWEVEDGWLAPNILRVQVDQVRRNPPVQVTVTTHPERPFHFDRRLDTRP